MALDSWLRGARRRLPREALPLVLFRGLVVLASVTWLAVGPPGLDRPRLVAGVLAAFTGYGLGLFILLSRRPEPVLRWDRLILGIDLAFAVVIVRLTGGVHSVFFLAFYLITALQAYYHGPRRGLGVAVLATLLDLVAVWPTMDGAAWANHALREGFLFVSALGLGAVGELERQERREILALNRALADRDRFVRDMVHSLRDGMVVLDREGRIVEWNRRMEEHGRRPAAEVLGQPLAAALGDALGERLASGLAAVYAGGADRSTVDRVRRRGPDGREAILDLKGHAIRTADGTLRGALLLVEDVTDRVRLEEALREAERLAGLGTLAAGLAHEINNPVGVIAARSELLLEDAGGTGLGDQTRQDLMVIRAHAQRVGRITRSLLDFAGHRRGAMMAIDLNRLVDETLRRVTPELGEAGVRLRVELAPGLPPVEGDPGLLGQVLRILVDNARDALPAGGEVTVRTEADPLVAGRVQLFVRDTGVGLPEAARRRLFEPFFTTKAARSGLGLAVCYGIVREHHGEIEVESRPAEGTTVRLLLPGRDPVTARTEP